MGCQNSAISPIDFEPNILRCHKCGKQNKTLMRLECNHHYDTECLIEIKMKSNNCSCNKPIGQLRKINEVVHNLILIQQIQVLFYKNYNKRNQQYKFVRCPNKNCVFYFIYVEQLNTNKSKKFFCDLCECIVQFDKQIFDNSNLKESIAANETEQSTNNDKVEKYKLQLIRIIKSTQLPIKFCKNNCGFLYIENNNSDINIHLCQNCDFCMKCEKQIFQDFIQIKNCQHNFHILCAFSLIDKNNLKSLKCDCGYLMDDEIKKQLNIICMICGEYEDNLKLLDCQHYIHLNCISNNASKFRDFKCYICQIPILNFLQHSNHNDILKLLKLENEKILKQIQKDCIFCLNQTSENLCNTNCTHKFHQTCLQTKQLEMKNMSKNFLNCLCGEKFIYEISK